MRYRYGTVSIASLSDLNFEALYGRTLNIVIGTQL